MDSNMLTKKICLIIIKKSVNIKPKRISKEVKNENQKLRTNKWLNKEFVCLNCHETYKNNYSATTSIGATQGFLTNHRQIR